MFLEFYVLPVLVVTTELGEVASHFGASDGGNELDVRGEKVAGLAREGSPGVTDQPEVSQCRHGSVV